jgi:hypothetical protein
MDESKPKRKGRGKAKKPSMIGTSIRLPLYVLEWFILNHPYDKQSAMRAVLIKHIEDSNHGKSQIQSSTD